MYTDFMSRYFIRERSKNKGILLAQLSEIYAIFITCKNIYVFTTRKAWNGWFWKRKHGCKGLISIFWEHIGKSFKGIGTHAKTAQNILYILSFQNILSIFLYYFDKKNLHF